MRFRRPCSDVKKCLSSPVPSHDCPGYQTPFTPILGIITGLPMPYHNTAAYGILCIWHPRCFSRSMAVGVLALPKSSFCTCYREPLSASHNLLYFSFLSERSGRRMPPAERSALLTYVLALLRQNQRDSIKNHRAQRERSRSKVFESMEAGGQGGQFEIFCFFRRA